MPGSRQAQYRHNAEDDKKYKKALRFIYKYGQETNKLTDEAVEACKRQGIKQEELLAKTIDDFVSPEAQTQTQLKGKSSMSPMTRHHKAQLLESENNLADVRLRHHENRRKRKCSRQFLSINILTSVIVSLVTVLKLYDYMAVMSNVLMAQQSNPNASKISNASFNNGLNAMTQKSNRSKMSPIKADKQFIAFEQNRMAKDETRNTFSSIVGNLPSINRRTAVSKGPPVSTTHKRIKRKASIPIVAKTAQPRTTQSVGPSGLHTTEASTVLDGNTTGLPSNLTVTK